MSATSVSTESGAAAAQQTLPKPNQATETSPQRPPASARTEVRVETSLKEPILSVAEKADVDRALSIRSITEVADDIEDAIDTLNSALAKAPTKAIISHDDQLNRYIVKIADESSGEVIREIPSEAVLKFARNLQEIKGLLFDKAL
jgi:flagellar protein FlaG